MLVKSIFAGFGGQGVLSMGLNLAEAAMNEGRYVTYLPAYGAEVRGGTANCTVAVSDEEISSPVASTPEFVVVMNLPSVIRFENQLKAGGLLFVNSSLVEGGISRTDIEVVKVAANGIAEKLGNPRSSNMVMLGAFVRKTKLVAFDSVLEAFKATLGSKAKLLAVNREALQAGYGLF